MAARSRAPILAVTQGDAAGVGPEILVALAVSESSRYRLLLVAEEAALSQVSAAVSETAGVSFHYLTGAPSRDALDEQPPHVISVLDPVAEPRQVRFGRSGAADAAGALACLDAGIRLAQQNVVDALVTAPVSKASIATHHLPSFRGHTDYLAERCGLERYGREYLMAFLTSELQVALLTTHVPLVEAVRSVSTEALSAALECLHRHAGGRIAVAGLNPHAGEGGLLGGEEADLIRPAVEAGRTAGIDVAGPESADSVFSRARRGEFDWVLALFHDQGLIAVKTLAFGGSTNWTLGLPFLRTSVDHGTGFEIAGQGLADATPLRMVCETTCDLVSGRLPRRRA
ncbi:MAG: 4-hydroxythreonine-4-phosphate dehydrogenase PdxA [Acidobacteriota bacterium]|nr:4-hydroxythreonine-4-phosphate dehydrogenase PdxA [Acidobacteriota bacterium]